MTGRIPTEMTGQKLIWIIDCHLRNIYPDRVSKCKVYQLRKIFSDKDEIAIRAGPRQQTGTIYRTSDVWLHKIVSSLFHITSVWAVDILHQGRGCSSCGDNIINNWIGNLINGFSKKILSINFSRHFKDLTLKARGDLLVIFITQTVQ